jgi:hypothetical protein
LRVVVPALGVLPGCAATGVTDQPVPAHGRPTSKVSADLAQLQQRRASPQPPGGGGREPANPAIRIVDDRVLIDAVASEDVNALKADLEALGMRDAVAFGRVVSGQLPIRAIDALNGLATLQFARPAYVSVR